MNKDKYNNPSIKTYYAGAALSEEPLLIHDNPVTVDRRKYYGVVTVKYCIGDPWSDEGRSIMEGRFGLIKSMDARTGDSFLPCVETHCDRDLNYPVLKVCEGTVKSLTMVEQNTKGETVSETQITGLHAKKGGTYQHAWFWVLLNPVLYTNHKS